MDFSVTKDECGRQLSQIKHLVRYLAADHGGRTSSLRIAVGCPWHGNFPAVGADQGGRVNHQIDAVSDDVFARNGVLKITYDGLHEAF